MQTPLVESFLLALVVLHAGEAKVALHQERDFVAEAAQRECCPHVDRDRTHRLAPHLLEEGPAAADDPLTVSALERLVMAEEVEAQLWEPTWGEAAAEQSRVATRSRMCCPSDSPRGHVEL